MAAVPNWPRSDCASSWTAYWEQPIRCALEAMWPVCGKSILTIGCGTDPIAGDLARAGARVVALDISHELLVTASSRWSNVFYVQADAADPPVLNGSFDITLSVSTLQYMPELKKVIRACRKALRPGGLAIFIENLAGNPVAKLDRLRRSAFRIPEEPTMHIRAHLSLADLRNFEEYFRSVSACVWHDWSTIFYPFMTWHLPGERFVERLIRTTASPHSPEHWRARYGWL